MSDLKLAIILGSTRPGRNGKAVADWVLAKAKERPSADYELIDLADYPLPHLDEPIPASLGKYAGASDGAIRRPRPSDRGSACLGREPHARRRGAGGRGRRAGHAGLDRRTAPSPGRGAPPGL